MCKMKKGKILLLTNIYPSPELDLPNSTSVCHYFAKEWVKQGHDVRVIYNYPIYSYMLHFIARVFEKQIASIGAAFVATNRIKCDKIYVLDGVKIFRLPFYKLIPRSRYSTKNVDKQIAKILNYLDEDNFIPDIITGHFPYQNIELVSKLKNIYNAKSCIVLHGSGDTIKKIFPSNHSQLMANIDVWGYRSLAIKAKFEKEYGVAQKSFMCYSGIPNQYLDKMQAREIALTCNKFIYVGALIKRKHPIALIHALNIAFPLKNFELTIIGEGAELGKIHKLIHMLHLESNIHLLGRVSREQVVEKMALADCFVMISENETFGLVYLEAMAQGCLTIVSKNEGMDGIIQDGINGFLCSAGDVVELSKIIQHINALSIKAKKEISYNAIRTVKMLTDDNVARSYYNSVV